MVCKEDIKIKRHLGRSYKMYLISKVEIFWLLKKKHRRTNKKRNQRTCINFININKITETHERGTVNTRSKITNLRQETFRHKRAEKNTDW